MIVALTGKDSIKINNRILADFADGENATLAHPNDQAVVKTGKDGNSIYAYNNTGRQCDLTLRLIRSGADDRYINNLNALFKNDPAAFTLITGEFIKNVGDGKGNITQEIYTLSGGVIKRNPDAKEDADGNTEQAVVVWQLVFSNAPRSIG